MRHSRIHSYKIKFPPALLEIEEIFCEVVDRAKALAHISQRRLQRSGGLLHDKVDLFVPVHRLAAEFAGLEHPVEAVCDATALAEWYAEVLESRRDVVGGMLDVRCRGGEEVVHVVDVALQDTDHCCVGPGKAVVEEVEAERDLCDELAEPVVARTPTAVAAECDAAAAPLIRLGHGFLEGRAHRGDRMSGRPDSSAPRSHRVLGWNRRGGARRRAEQELRRRSSSRIFGRSGDRPPCLPRCGRYCGGLRYAAILLICSLERAAVVATQLSRLSVGRFLGRGRVRDGAE